MCAAEESPYNSVCTEVPGHVIMMLRLQNAWRALVSSTATHREPRIHELSSKLPGKPDASSHVGSGSSKKRGESGFLYAFHAHSRKLGFACGNCNGALDVDSRNATETITYEALLTRSEHNATYRGQRPGNRNCLSRLVLPRAVVRFLLLPATNHGSRLSCCRARNARTNYV
jgi:hypothetical protein